MILTGNWAGEIALQVNWGGTLIPCDWISNEQAHVVVPAGTAGASVNVFVVTPAGSSNALSYFYDYASYHDAVVADSPLSWYRLGEAAGAGTVADSGSLGIAGTVNGGVTLGVAGALPHDTDTAALFNGSTGYIVAAAHNYALASFTLEAWIKTTDSSASRHRIWQQQDSGYMILSINGGLLEFGSSLDSILTTKGSSIADGAWHHVAVVRDTAAGTATWYVDGVSVGTASGVVATAYSSTLPAYISRYAGGGEFFNGSLDEVAVYGTALSATSIAAHYNAR